MEDTNVVLYWYYKRCMELEEELDVVRRYAEIQTRKLERTREINEHLIEVNEKLTEDNINCRILAKSPLKYQAKAHAYKIEMRRCQRKLQRIYAEHIRIQSNIKAMVLYLSHHMRIVSDSNLEELWHAAEEIQKLRNV